MSQIGNVTKEAQFLSKKAAMLSEKISTIAQTHQDTVVSTGIDPFVFSLTIFLLACFVGYYVVWKVTPALHTPLISVTNAISGIVIVGAILIVGPEGFGISQFLGFFAIMIASINIFGGFIVTQRMLEMFKKKK